MKAITIKQPWASLICENGGIKDVENRSWRLPDKYKGQRVLIHAGSDTKNDRKPLTEIYTPSQLDCLLKHYTELELCKKQDDHGAIIGSIVIADCVQNHASPWAIENNYHWVLAYPHLFPEPIPVKGRLSFWDYPYIIAETEEEGGKLFCHCQLPVKESNQVYSMIDHFRCHYCGGRWYK